MTTRPGDHPGGYPPPAAATGRVESSPRRVRVLIDDHVVVDTRHAKYVWEHPPYPRYYVPVDDIDAATLVDEQSSAAMPLGTATMHALVIGARRFAGSVAVFSDGDLAGLARIDPNLAEAKWFEEDEQIFVHPRSPYARVDAIRSSRHVRVESDGVVLAESRCPVIIFETGLAPRYYLPRTDVDFTKLVPSETVTSCPYKGTTSEYWSVPTRSGVIDDVAWAYDFPTREALPVAGLVAFYDERVDVFVDGRLSR